MTKKPPKPPRGGRERILKAAKRYGRAWKAWRTSRLDIMEPAYQALLDEMVRCRFELLVVARETPTRKR